MGEKATVESSMSTFVGMVSNLNRKDLKPGQSSIQVNVAANQPGVLAIRRGLRELIFDADDS